MDNLIQWPRAQYWDKPWNPWLGCKPISPACDNCYARCATVERFGQSFEPHKTHKVSPPNSGVVFCGNMTDLFGEFVPIFESMDFFSRLWYFPGPHSSAKPNNATYLFCTKRVDRMCDALRNYTQIPHAYFGFTAENQEWYDKRIKDFRAEMPEWAKCWLSAEPLLGMIDLGLRYIAPEDMPFDWVAVGCESGKNRRPCKMEWVESIVYQCCDANIPVFVKQLDLNGKCERDITKFPKHLQIRQVPWARETNHA